MIRLAIAGMGLTAGCLLNALIAASRDSNEFSALYGVPIALAVAAIFVTASWDATR